MRIAQLDSILAHIDDEQAKRRAAEAAQIDLQQKLAAARADLDALHTEAAAQAAELADMKRERRAAP